MTHLISGPEAGQETRSPHLCRPMQAEAGLVFSELASFKSGRYFSLLLEQRRSREAVQPNPFNLSCTNLSKVTAI